MAVTVPSRQHIVVILVDYGRQSNEIPKGNPSFLGATSVAEGLHC
jgi:hypothetical protein